MNDGRGNGRTSEQRGGEARAEAIAFPPPTPPSPPPPPVRRVGPEKFPSALLTKTTGRARCGVTKGGARRSGGAADENEALRSGSCGALSGGGAQNAVLVGCAWWTAPLEFAPATAAPLPPLPPPPPPPTELSDAAGRSAAVLRANAALKRSRADVSAVARDFNIICGPIDATPGVVTSNGVRRDDDDDASADRCANEDDSACAELCDDASSTAASADATRLDVGEKRGAARADAPADVDDEATCSDARRARISVSTDGAGG